MPKVPTEGKKKKNVPTEVVTGNRKRRAKKSEQEMEVLADNGHVDPEMDSEDEELAKRENTIGKVPLEWYGEYDHIGYSRVGQKVVRQHPVDELENFLSKMDNPETFWRTLRDKSEGKDVVISDEVLDIVRRIKNAQFPDKNFDPYQDHVDIVSSQKEIFPMSASRIRKDAFLPSKYEAAKINSLVKAIQKGVLRLEPKPEPPKYYSMWNDTDAPGAPKRWQQNLRQPSKTALPTHAESYNPPEEYLFTEEELAAWQAQEPRERRINFLPKKASSLRALGSYPEFARNRFERCLDIYLCPRLRVKARTMRTPLPQQLPLLPRPKDLRPFPCQLSLVYEGHKDRVRTIAISPDGQWLVSGSDDCTAIVWEVQTGRCIKRWQFEQKVISVSWNPNTELPVVAIATGHSAILANPMAWTSSIEPFRAATSVEEDQPVRWTLPTPAQKEDGLLCILEHQTDLKQVIWHRKGDYFATIAPKSNDVVLIHQLSRRQSQRPFQKSIGEVERVLFHPQKPQLVVASRQAIRVYDLAEQRKVATLKPTVQWLSSIDIHPQGEHMLVGAYDRKACWFETELSSKPCRVFRHYNRAVRQVAFHRKNPLFATCGDDGNVLVFHCRIFDDWATDTLLVPVKILRGHRVVSGIGVMDCVFHPNLPWLFTSGADGSVRLFTN